MAIPVFPVSIPQPSRSRTPIKTSVAQVSFGDKYMQASARGINTDWFEFELDWSDLSSSEYDAIESFIKPKLKRTPFNWTDHRGNTYQLICNEFEPEPLTADLYNLSLRCVEDFTV